jgi:hypothetical protein
MKLNRLMVIKIVRMTFMTGLMPLMCPDFGLTKSLWRLAACRRRATHGQKPGQHSHHQYEFQDWQSSAARLGGDGVTFRLAAPAGCR